MGVGLFRRCVFLAAFIAWEGGEVHARGDGTFQTPLVLPAQNAVSCAAGDFDGDGRLDLAAVGGSVVTVWLQNPASRVKWKSAPSIALGSASFFIRSADFDEDGAADLLVADPGSSAYFLRSQRDGTFETPVKLGAPQPRWIAAADFDGDGDLDLASANHPVRTVSLFSGRGAEFSLLKVLSFPYPPHAIEALEYNGDGKIDLLLGFSEEGNSPLRGSGDGNFDKGAAIPQFPCIAYLATGDFNRDGLGDLAMSCEETSAFWSVNLGNGVFRDPQYAPPGAGYNSTAVADLNGDGLEDIAVAGSQIRTLYVYPGKGDGTFLPPAGFHSTGINPFFLSAADLDGDGRTDLATANTGSSTLTIFRGRNGERFLESASPITGFSSAAALALTDLDLDGAQDLLVSSSDQARISVYRKPGRSSPSAPSTVLELANVYNAIQALDLDGDATPDLAGVVTGPGLAAVALLGPAGTIRSEKSFPTGTLPARIAAGPIDRDHGMDLAVLCPGPSEVDVLLSTGAGGFAPALAVRTIRAPRRMAMGDLDGDGLADLALVGLDRLAMYFATGDGNLTEVLPPQKIPQELAAGDLNGDGRDDLLASVGKDLYLFLAQEGRRLEEPRARPLPGIAALELADLDGDGQTDVIADTPTSASVAVLLNLGPAGLGEPMWYSLGISARDHAIADLDQDGALDLVALGRSEAMVLFGRPAAAVVPGRFIRGDADGDRQVTITDPIAVLNRFFLGGAVLPCDDAADSNDDGEVNLSDPIATLNRLFLGGEVLPPPGPAACGEDPTADPLPDCGSGC